MASTGKLGLIKVQLKGLNKLNRYFRGSRARIQRNVKTWSQSNEKVLTLTSQA